MNCPNCQSKTGKSFLSGENKVLTQDSLIKLNQFIPEYLRKDSFCFECSSYQQYTAPLNHIYSRYKYYISNIEGDIVKLKSDLEKLEVKKIEERLNNDFIESIKIYSNSPSGFESIEMVECFLVVNSGMWSTSSDNLDPMWSVLHDSMASKGTNSDSLLSKGFRDSKSVLKKQTFLKGGNSIIDVKYNFSELAGNGKILLYLQGTASINPKLDVPSFNSIDTKFNIERDKINNSINELNSILQVKSLSHFGNLIRELQFE
jgi:hypothetical protein